MRVGMRAKYAAQRPMMPALVLWVWTIRLGKRFFNFFNILIIEKKVLTS